MLAVGAEEATSAVAEVALVDVEVAEETSVEVEAVASEEVSIDPH